MKTINGITSDKKRGEKVIEEIPNTDFYLHPKSSTVSIKLRNMSY